MKVEKQVLKKQCSTDYAGVVAECCGADFCLSLCVLRITLALNLFRKRLYDEVSLCCDSSADTEYLRLKNVYEVCYSAGEPFYESVYNL